MKHAYLLLLCCIAAVPLRAQTYVNPFADNKNTFNQKDIIILRNAPGTNNVVQQVHGFDWVAHNAGQTSNVITSLAPEGSLTGVTLGSNRYMSAKAGRFMNGPKDQIFQVMRTTTGWQCALNELEMTFNEADSTYDHALESPANYVTIPATGSGFPKVAVGDLDGDGLSEAAVAWWEPLNDRVHIQVLDSDNSLELELRASINAHSSLRVNGQYHAYDLGLGDLNGDGKAELILTGLGASASGNASFQVYVQVYEVMGSGSASLMARGGLVLNDEDIEGNGGDALAYVQTAVAGLWTRPDTMPDTSRDIFAAFDFTRYGSQGGYVNFFQYVLRASADLNTLTVLDDASATIGGGSSFLENYPLEIGIGDLNGDRIDDVALLARNGIRLFTVIDDQIEPKGTFGSGVTGEGSYGMNEAVDRMEVGDVDMDDRDELVLFTHYQDQEPPDEHTFTLQVFGRDADFGPDPPGQASYIYDNASGATRAHAIVLGNLDGLDLRLGQPNVKACEYIQPAFMIGAIPSHFDVLNSVQYDVNNCYPVQDCDLSVRITQTGSSSTSAQVEITSDWSVSAAVDGELEVYSITLGASLTEKYGEKFSAVNTETNSQTISIAITASADDMVQYVKIPITLFEYPVLDAVGDTMTWIAAAFPANDLSPQTIVANGKSIFNYTPEHEVGNILSYPPIDASYGGVSDLPGATGNWIILDESNVPNYTMSPSGGITYTLTSTTGIEWSNASTSYSSTEMGASIKGFGIGVKVDGTYEASQMNLYKNSISEQTEFEIAPTNIIGSPNEFNYVISPKIYWNSDGSGVVSFELDMDGSPGSGSFWSQAYSAMPDAALNLPYRYEQVINPDLTNTANLLRTKSMRFSTLLPQVGDTFSIFLRVYNYSFAPTTIPVAFSLYLGDPGQGGTLIPAVDGSTVFGTSASLGPRGREEVEVRVVATAQMVVNDFVRIFAQLDPDNALQEIHEGNNLGWAQFGYACNQPGVLVGIEDVGTMPPNDDRLLIYPVPASDQVVIEHDLRGTGATRGEVRITDLLGAEVARFNVATTYPGRIFWNTRSIAPGMYVVGLLDEKDLRRTGKAIIE